MDMESTLDFVATVGYDVDFLRGKAIELLASNPIAKDEGAEHFNPRCAPANILAANGPWAARLLQGGGTFIDELAGKTVWHGSLDLRASVHRVSEMVLGWMGVKAPVQSNLILLGNHTFPVWAPTAEQFYSLRDAIHFSEQWLSGTPSSRPALTLMLAFCIGVDEFLCPIDSLDSTVYLGRKIGDLWEECAIECDNRTDAVRWLALAKSALRSSVFLQNREKLAYMGLFKQDTKAFTDWDTTAHYMLRAEAAMTPFVGFCLCAYSGLPFREDLTGAVGLYCYGNAFVLDFCKRSTHLGEGNYTEVALSANAGELQGRSHLIGSLLSYGESILPSLFLCVLRPYVLANSLVVDMLD
jgi:hypothetical protein